MSPFETATVTAAYRTRCEDRVAVLELGDRLVIIVADGAGGSGNGVAAADTVIREISAAAHQATTAERWTSILTQVDLRIGDGESTGVVVDLSPAGICGASVGDSQAWVILDGQLQNLTDRQQRKPLLGSGRAHPIGFSAGPLTGMLVTATDGFSNYVDRARFLAQLPTIDFVSLPEKLLELVRLKSGELWDDVGIVICRPRSHPRPGNKTYTI